MLSSGALDLALALRRMPTLAAAMRQAPLPPDVGVLIRLAGGCETTRREAEQATGSCGERLAEAAVLYLQQIMLHPQADSHRTLGAAPGASRDELRQNRTWLLRWLHPDLNKSGWETVLAERVIAAWRDLADGAPVEAPMRQAHQDGGVPLVIPWIMRPIRRDRIASRRRGRSLVMVVTLGLGASLLALYLARTQFDRTACGDLGSVLEDELRSLLPSKDPILEMADRCGGPAAGAVQGLATADDMQANIHAGLLCPPNEISASSDGCAENETAAPGPEGESAR